MRRFIYKQQYLRPEATRVSDGVIMRLEHVYEVDPDLMGTHFRQQNMPLWDTLRIVESRNEHLSWTSSVGDREEEATELIQRLEEHCRAMG